MDDVRRRTFGSPLQGAFAILILGLNEDPPSLPRRNDKEKLYCAVGGLSSCCVPHHPLHAS